MNRRKLSRVVTSTRLFALIAVAALGILLSGSAAKAGCFSSVRAAAPARIPFVSPPAQAQESRQGEEWEHPRSIVGLWHLIYTATYSTLPSPPFPATTPFQFLESYKTWHADGTEFEQAFLPPTGGDICFGVWKDLGEGRVKLHHIGLMFGSDGSVSNVFTVDETDRVSADGKSYSGNFDFKLFPASDVMGTGTALAEAKGTTAGTRITVD
jgi:hypothetical protein